MKVLVLGCGPAGLFATHAAALAGHDVKIVSKKRKSELFGAQYLHEPIPHVLDKDVSHEVRYDLMGDAASYRRKVYGEGWRGTVSPEDMTESHRAYDLRATYDALWNTYSEYIVDMVLDEGIGGMLAAIKPDVTFSTVPAPVLCSNQSHSFRSQHVYAVGDAPERGIECPVQNIPEFSVVCNGEDAPAWYRAANIFGYRTAEWPGWRRPPIDGIADVEKPLDTNCDCFLGVIRLGRYGRWQKGILSHTAFKMAANHLQLMIQEPTLW